MPWYFNFCAPHLPNDPTINFHRYVQTGCLIAFLAIYVIIHIYYKLFGPDPHDEKEVNTKSTGSFIIRRRLWHWLAKLERIIGKFGEQPWGRQIDIHRRRIATGWELFDWTTGQEHRQKEQEGRWVEKAVLVPHTVKRNNLRSSIIFPYRIRSLFDRMRADNNVLSVRRAIDRDGGVYTFFVDPSVR